MHDLAGLGIVSTDPVTQVASQASLQTTATGIASSILNAITFGLLPKESADSAIALATRLWAERQAQKAAEEQAKAAAAAAAAAAQQAAILAQQQAQMRATAPSSGIPSWVLPAAGVVAAVFILPKILG